MSIRKAIYDLLKAAETDVYPLVAPQELKVPYITFNMRRTPERTQDGVTLQIVGLTLMIYASDLSDCFNLAETMYTALEGAEGTYDGEELMVSNWTVEDGEYIEQLDKYLVIQEYSLTFT